MENGKKSTGTGHEIVGLILAAGYSSRMGAFKPLLTIGNVTAIERISSTLKQAGVERIIGVTGFQRERLSRIFAAEGITEAYNPDFEQGMFTSIQAGVRKAVSGSETDAAVAAGLTKAAGLTEAPDSAAPSSPDGFYLMLVDSPLIPPEVLEMMRNKHAECPEAFIVPCFRGKKGHPLFIPARYTEEILSHQGEGGLKAITDRYQDRLIRLETGTEAVVLDMDTPEGYKEILDFYERQSGAAGADEEEPLKGKRLFLIRHGEIRQHKEKIFLGQTDVPLSEKGREQAARAAEELIRYGISAKRIYTSDLSRAAETAEIIGRRLKLTVSREPKLRELSLGEWDGRYINEIREKYPEEYRKRGENLLTYKHGNDSENFFDLQYRVMKGFRSILERERKTGGEGDDLVIVSHSGVMNVIVSNLKHKELADQMKRRIPDGGMIVIGHSGNDGKQSEDNDQLK